MYTGANKDHLLYGAMDATWPPYPNWPTWEDFLVPQLSTARPQVDYYAYYKLFYCIESPNTLAWVQTSFHNAGYQASFSFNKDIFLLAGSAASPALRLNQVKRPSANFTLTCGTTHTTRYTTLETAPNWESHQKSANFVYLDGHVEAVRREAVWNKVAFNTALLLRD